MPQAKGGRYVKNVALAVWAQWIECGPWDQRLAGSIPGQGHTLRLQLDQNGDLVSTQTLHQATQSSLLLTSIPSSAHDPDVCPQSHQEVKFLA